MTRLGLGTVQFGIEGYGVANQRGGIDLPEVSSILDGARAGGIRLLDTAAVYGTAESVLGRVLPAGDAHFRIVTKIAAMRGSADVSSIQRGVDESLARLRRSQVHGLLMHDAQDLLGPSGDAVFKALNAQKEAGTIARIGVSVYDIETALTLAGRYGIDLVQLPLNILDQRPLREGRLAALRNGGVEVHARSAFLQGLLLMEGGGRHSRFQPYTAVLDAVHAAAAAELEISPLELCLRWMRHVAKPDVVLIGVTSRVELDACVAAFSGGTVPDLEALACDDPFLIDPRTWS